MADVAGEEAAVYWSEDASDEEQQLVYTPGLCLEGNHRPVPKFKIFKAEDIKLNAAHPEPGVKMDEFTDWQEPSEQQVSRGEAGVRSVSLKDLCPEDKRRIANLIKELARVSEEKEVTEERLKLEHESFEKKIRHLEEQNNLIASEREALQQQYRECQELLSLYQKYLSEQREKLNLSPAELSARGCRPQQVLKGHRMPTASELNGSYLNQPCHKPSSESESLCSFVMRPKCRGDDRTCRTGGRCSSDGRFPEQYPQRMCYNVGLPDAQTADMNHSYHCASAINQPMSCCCLHRAPHTTPGQYAPEFSHARPPEHCTLTRPSTVPVLTNGVETRPKDSSHEKGISEQQKHELLLQKLELELEKERLQHLLEQKEAKLLEKQQELQQSRWESNRYQAATDPQTKNHNVIATPSSGAILVPNGSVYSPVKMSSIGIPTPPSSGGSRNPRSPDTRNVAMKEGGFRARHPGEGTQSSVCKGSRRDAATSPASPKVEMKGNGTSPELQDIYRYETSLIDMLEAVSPVSSRKPQTRYREPRDINIMAPSPRGPNRSPVRREAPTVDLEERRILEDIFFIC